MGSSSPALFHTRVPAPDYALTISQPGECEISASPSSGPTISTSNQSPRTSVWCYELEMNPGSVPELIQRFDLQFPAMPI